MTPPSGGGGQPGGGGDYEYNPKLPGPSPKTLNRKIPRNSTTTRWKDTDGTEGGPVIDNGGRIFGQKCRQATLLGSGNTGSSILQAACIADGRWWQTTLNLNQCIGIRGRQLVFEERYVSLPSLPPYLSNCAAWVWSRKAVCGFFNTKLYFRSGNYDRTCRPCGIDADTATSHVVLPCTCLSNQDGAPSFTELLLAGHGMRTYLKPRRY